MIPNSKSPTNSRFPFQERTHESISGPIPTEPWDRKKQKPTKTECEFAFCTVGGRFLPIAAPYNDLNGWSGRRQSSNSRPTNPPRSSQHQNSRTLLLLQLLVLQQSTALLLSCCTVAASHRQGHSLLRRAPQPLPKLLASAATAGPPALRQSPELQHFL